MCRIFAEQDPSGFQSVTRSIRLSGHSTSIRLETAFWRILDDIAESQDLTTAKFLSKLHDEVIELRGEAPNFASMLRTTCLLHLSGRKPDAAELAELAMTPCAGGGETADAADRHAV